MAPPLNMNTTVPQSGNATIVASSGVDKSVFVVCVLAIVVVTVGGWVYKRRRTRR